MDIGQLLQNSAAITGGAWIKPDPDRYPDLEINTRGYTDEWVDRRNELLGIATKAQGPNAERLPTAVARGVEIEAWAERCFLGQRGLTTTDAGATEPRPITDAEFLAYVASPGGRGLWTLCMAAQAKVGAYVAATEQSAVGN